VTLSGARLGNGAGHYDRLLSRWPRHAIGLALSVQVVPSLPTEPHDVVLDEVVTAPGSGGSLPFGFYSDPSVHHSVAPGSGGSLPFGFNSDPSVHHSVAPGSGGSLPFGFYSDPSVHHSVAPGSGGSLPFGFYSDPSVHHSVAPGTFESGSESGEE
jgi:hypothetical protein